MIKTNLLTRYIALTALCIALLGNVTVYTTAYQTNERTCKSVEALKANARAQIDRSARTLPSLAYYKSHPGELAIALKQVKEAKQEFAALSCKQPLIP